MAAAIHRLGTDPRNFVEFGKKIVCVGRNFKDHALELNNPIPKEPLIFLKPSSSYVTEGTSLNQYCIR